MQQSGTTGFSCMYNGVNPQFSQNVFLNLKMVTHVSRGINFANWPKANITETNFCKGQDYCEEVPLVFV